MSHPARTSVRLSALLLAGLAACGDPSPTPAWNDIPDAPLPADREEALGRLSESEREEFERWQDKLEKRCAVEHVVRGEEKARATAGIDVDVLATKLDKGNVLRDGARFALLDIGAPVPFASGTSTETVAHAVTVGGKTKQQKRTLSARREDEVCVVSVDGFEIARVTLRDQVDVRAVFDGKHTEVTDLYGVSGDAITATVDPAVFLEAAESALTGEYDWVAEKLGLSGLKRLRGPVVAESRRLIAGDQQSTWMVGSDARFDPTFLSTAPDAFVTAPAVSVEHRFALWTATGGATASVAVQVEKKGEPSALTRGYELTAKATGLGAVSTDAVDASAVGACVAGVLAAPLAAFGAHEGAFHLEGELVFSACSGLALDPVHEALRSRSASAALGRWFSDENMQSMYGVDGWEPTLVSWLALALTDDDAQAGLSQQADLSSLLARLASAGEVVRAALPGRSAAEELRARLPELLVSNIVAARFHGEQALDVAALVENADALYRLDPALLGTYLTAAQYNAEMAQRGELCVAKLTNDQRARIVALRTKQTELVDLEDWGLDFTHDSPVSRWVFEENGCTEEGLRSIEASLAAAIDFVAEERERGLSYNGDEDVAQLVAFGLMNGYGTTQYMQLASLAVLFRTDTYCASEQGVSEVLVCSLGDLSVLSSLLDARYEGRYAVLAPEFAKHVEALKDPHFLVAAELQTAFKKPVWSSCNAAQFTEKRAALSDAVEDLTEAGIAADYAAIDTVLDDCSP